MTAPPSYRQIAETTLGQAAAVLNALPQGSSPTPVVVAASANAQAIATIALVQALLDIGDVLRAQLPSAEAQ